MMEKRREKTRTWNIVFFPVVGHNWRDSFEVSSRHRPSNRNFTIPGRYVNHLITPRVYIRATKRSPHAGSKWQDSTLAAMPTGHSFLVLLFCCAVSLYPRHGVVKPLYTLRVNVPMKGWGTRPHPLSTCHASSSDAPASWCYVE